MSWVLAKESFITKSHKQYCTLRNANYAFVPICPNLLSQIGARSLRFNSSGAHQGSYHTVLEIFAPPVRIPDSRPVFSYSIMWTCVVRVTRIVSIVSEGEGI